MYIQCTSKRPAVDCGIPRPVRHAVVSISTNTTYKGVADYKCLDGYWFSKDLFCVSSTCLWNGEWFPIPEQCIREYSYVIDM